MTTNTSGSACGKGGGSPSQLGLRGFSRSVVEGVASSNPAHSPAAGLG